MIDLLIGVTILVIVILVLWFLLKQVPLPEPANQIVRIAAVVIVAVIVIGLLLNFGGRGDLLWLRR